MDDNARLAGMLEHGCSGCAFFDDREGRGDLGECHRYAPRVALSFELESVQSPDARWAVVLREEFCGEWQGKPTRGA